MPQIDIEQDVLDCIVETVYKQWTEEYDLLKKVREETDDGSPDWALFHAERMKNHTNSFIRWNALNSKFASLHSMNRRG